MEEKPVLLVYFVGGVTFMELAALRFLSRRPSFPYSVVCCTTEIVNGGTLLRSLSCQYLMSFSTTFTNHYAAQQIYQCHSHY
mmetsp:Transcript_14964/g.24329  ORF Transcript_14964/g.24329 Transcript_14964/m.24329 type:complete len:82 (+) Transcript_14964:343-588(+)